MAAELWPGEGRDRKRFIELLIQFGPASPSLATVSVPLLVEHLLSTPISITVGETLQQRAKLTEKSLVITGEDVDRPSEELLSLVPALETKMLRQHSYACLLYEELRCSYVHEYRPGVRGDSWPMTTRPSAVSYVNKLESVIDLDGNVIHRSTRLIHFHIRWLVELATSIAKRIDDLRLVTGRPVPKEWWIDGS